MPVRAFGLFEKNIGFEGCRRDDEHNFMNILQTESSLNWGGQEYRTLLEHQFINEKTGHRSYFLCDPRSEIVVKARAMGILDVITVSVRRTLNFLSAIRIARLVVINRIDVIHAHGSRDAFLSLVSYLFGAKIVRSRQITSPINGFFSYRFLCSHVIASAELIKKNLIDGSVSGEKITVVGEGVDLDAFAPRAKNLDLIAALKEKDEKFVFINIGMIRGDKGQRYYVESARILLERNSDCFFLLVGEGTGSRALEKSLKEEVARDGLGENILFLGYREDVADLINLADVVVIASTGVEAQSRIAPQAFANATPVVSTNAGALTEMVKHMENGLVVDPKDSQAMADAMIMLMQDPLLRNTLGENGRRFAIQKLGFGVMMEKTLDVYKKVIKR
jgi:glycosyltransferase involved in cell wall biosynthesis